ncbi:FDLD family class I lanthipeptide [Allokutzneria albata]|uniref:Uncharacterized protein n=1 Tax=Allokutzneria albata TaxID=211114 RepID=A0A1G9V5C0_ALLAB|nr:FDLD family class I lanthipeptide [Allokutzneria albata]SDM67391.1 hypothetical protein SAMN04489726_2841 [Allokutzneria albata]
MNPDLDQFDLDVRVSTPRELGAEPQDLTSLRTCVTCKNCGITTSAPGN